MLHFTSKFRWKYPQIFDTIIVYLTTRHPAYDCLYAQNLYRVLFVCISTIKICVNNILASEVSCVICHHATICCVASTRANMVTLLHKTSVEENNNKLNVHRKNKCRLEQLWGVQRRWSHRHARGFWYYRYQLSSIHGRSYVVRTWTFCMIL